MVVVVATVVVVVEAVVVVVASVVVVVVARVVVVDALVVEVVGRLEGCTPFLRERSVLSSASHAALPCAGDPQTRTKWPWPFVEALEPREGTALEGATPTRMAATKATDSRVATQATARFIMLRSFAANRPLFGTATKASAQRSRTY